MGRSSEIARAVSPTDTSIAMMLTKVDTGSRNLVLESVSLELVKVCVLKRFFFPCSNQDR